MKVALVYDRVNKWGGAERVLLALHSVFPDAPLFTSVYNPKTAGWANVFQVKTSFLQKFPFASSAHEFYAMLMPLAFESLNFDEYDLVISVTSESAKGIITKPGTMHLCICLTPTRYLWSGYAEYFSNSFFRFITKPIIWYLKMWDKIAAQRPDVYIAISKEVQNRIKKYYDRESEVIYPPVSWTSLLGFLTLEDESKFDTKIKSLKSAVQNKNYYLVVSRLSRFTAYKRVDIAIQAANKLKADLKIVGEGRDMLYFKNISGGTVEFLGKVSDEELAIYYSHCKALIFSGLEDFGLTMVEAQLFGKPVIAYRGGGALEIVIEGKTGEFFDKQNYKSLAGKLENFKEIRYNSKTCIENAKRFSVEQFEKSLKRIVKEMLRV